MNEATGGPDDEIGSVADEAAKLFGAFSDWARDHGPDLGQGLSGLASQAATAAGEVNEHIATGAQECTYCPICRTVHVVRLASPEVRTHLALAAANLMQAAAGILAAASSEDAHGRSGRGGSVEHIDLDGGEWPEDPR
ncbi:MAG TPA: hypothetical protein VFY58_04355 [Nocardioides sp.]|nr:hypothetical protein [Nocardioides sp.]